MRTRFWHRAGLLATIAGLALAFPPQASAARVLKFAVRVDGKDQLVGTAGDNGDASAAVVWHRLATTELTPPVGVEIRPEVGDPLRAVLRGNIEIEVSYGAKAAVKELRLVREPPSAGWTVDSRDVEQIAKDIGLGGVLTPPALPPAPANSAETANQSPWLWVGAGLAAALFVSGFMVSWLRRQMVPPPSHRVTPAEPTDPPFAQPE